MSEERKVIHTFAHIDAALTIGKSESAFFVTVNRIFGNRIDNSLSYFSGGPTVSTKTYKRPKNLSKESKFEKLSEFREERSV